MENFILVSKTAWGWYYATLLKYRYGSIYALQSNWTCKSITTPSSIYSDKNNVFNSGKPTTHLLHVNPEGLCYQDDTVNSFNVEYV